MNSIGYVKLYIRTFMTDESDLHKMALIRGKEPYSFATVWGRSSRMMIAIFSLFFVICFGVITDEWGFAVLMGGMMGLFFGIPVGLWVAVEKGSGKTLYVEFSNEKEKASFFSNLNIGMLHIKKYQMTLKDDEFLLFQTRSGPRTKLWDISVIIGEKSALIIAPKPAMKTIERFV